MFSMEKLLTNNMNEMVIILINIIAVFSTQDPIKASIYFGLILVVVVLLKIKLTIISRLNGQAELLKRNLDNQKTE